MLPASKTPHASSCPHWALERISPKGLTLVEVRDCSSRVRYAVLRLGRS